MEQEEWRPIPGYEGAYEVSSLGRVRSLARTSASGHRLKSRILRASRMDAWGHLGVKLWSGATPTSYYVHHLVLFAFVGERPDGLVACHWNDTPYDNRLENLRWDTQRANRLDMARNGGDHNTRKINCKYGHPYTEENTRRYGGRRHCRTCQRRYDQEHKERQRIARKAAA